MIWLILAAVIWLLWGYVAYVYTREGFRRKHGGKWTKGDRRGFIWGCFLMPPAACIATWVTFGSPYVDNNEPASW